MKTRCVQLACALLLLLFSADGYAQKSYPMLMGIEPVAAQVGATTEHTVLSRYSMYGASQVLVSGEGVTGEIVHPEVPADQTKDGKIPNLTKMKLRFTVAADAKPGVRDFRLATPQGVSTLGQLVIARDAVVQEQGNNNSPEQAQEVTLPATMCGKIEKAEDVDYFKFQAKAGDALSFHVRSMRLQNRIHDLQQHSDPILTLRNSAGTTLAASDNFFYGDPMISHRFEHAGEYFLEVRDVRYQGNQYWFYSIEASGRPLITNVHPMGVSPGQSAKLELTGFQLPDPPTATLNIPADAPMGKNAFPLTIAGVPTNPLPVVVTDLPLVVEAAGENNKFEKGQPIEVPAAVSGRIETDQDVDYYTFEAKKGEAFSFEVIARRNGSALDSHLRMLSADSKQLGLADDMRLGKRGFADSWLENWVAPADGRFAVEIRDLHLRGGTAYVYLLKVTRAKPYFELYIDTDKTQLTPGTAGVLFVRSVRKNGFEGEIKLAIEGLPPGVSATCGTILGKIDKDGDLARRANSGGPMIDGCIILEPAQDSAQAVAQITVRGTATHEKEGEPPLELTAVAMPYQETYQPGGGRGHWPARSHVVSIGAPSDIRGMTLSATELTLKPGESQRIDVTIDRSPEYQKNITLDVLYKHLNRTYGMTLPRGVTLDSSGSKTLLDGKTNQGHLVLKAAADAPPVERHLVPVMAHVSLNFVMKATYAGKPLFVTVAPADTTPATDTSEAAK